MSVFSDCFNTVVPPNWETIEFSARCAGIGGGIRGPISVVPTPSWWLDRGWYVFPSEEGRAVLWYHPCFQEAVNRL